MDGFFVVAFGKKGDISSVNNMDTAEEGEYSKSSFAHVHTENQATHWAGLLMDNLAE